MADLEAKFKQAAEQVQDLPKRPDNATMLKLYAYYKQATVGDVTGNRPGFTDPVGRAKFDAWTEVKGATSKSAMQAYIDLVKKLKSS